MFKIVGLVADYGDGSAGLRLFKGEQDLDTIVESDFEAYAANESWAIELNFADEDEAKRILGESTFKYITK